MEIHGIESRHDCTTFWQNFRKIKRSENTVTEEAFVEIKGLPHSTSQINQKIPRKFKDIASQPTLQEPKSEISSERFVALAFV